MDLFILRSFRHGTVPNPHAGTPSSTVPPAAGRGNKEAPIVSAPSATEASYAYVRPDGDLRRSYGLMNLVEQRLRELRQHS